MKKETYETPQMTVVEMEMQSIVLTGSEIKTPISGGSEG